MANKKTSLRNYLTLSFIAAAFVGILVLASSHYVDVTQALIWAGITFIVALVGIATLALTVKDQDDDPDKPRLG
jgi:predicted PurR-regulated permease PerM